MYFVIERLVARLQRVAETAPEPTWTQVVRQHIRG